MAADLAARDAQPGVGFAPGVQTDVGPAHDAVAGLLVDELAGARAVNLDYLTEPADRRDRLEAGLAGDMRAVVPAFLV